MSHAAPGPARTPGHRLRSTAPKAKRRPVPRPEPARVSFEEARALAYPDGGAAREAEARASVAKARRILGADEAPPPAGYAVPDTAYNQLEHHLVVGATWTRGAEEAADPADRARLLAWAQREIDAGIALAGRHTLEELAAGVQEGVGLELERVTWVIDRLGHVRSRLEAMS